MRVKPRAVAFTPAHELPAWLAGFYVPIPRWRFPATLGDMWKYDEAAVRAEWNRGEWRVIARSESRHSLIVVSAMYALPARAWWWWRRRRWILEELALRIHLLRAPYDGAYYHECRFDPPDLWGRPLEKWEKYFV